MSFYILGVSAFDHEAYLLRVLFACYRKTCLFRYLSYLVLCKLRKRHDGACKLLLCELIQHISLILGCCCRLLYSVPSVFSLYHAGVMTCRHIFRIDLIGKPEQSLPLYVPVARNAWVRREAVHVIVYKRFRNVLPEFRQTVDVVKRYLKLHGNRACITDVAATAVSTASGLPRPQSHAYHLIALFLQQICSYRAVDSSRQPNHNSGNIHHLLSIYALRILSHPASLRNAVSAVCD